MVVVWTTASASGPALPLPILLSSILEQDLQLESPLPDDFSNLLPSYQLILYNKVIQSIIIILKEKTHGSFESLKANLVGKMLVSFSLKGKNLVFFKRQNAW